MTDWRNLVAPSLAIFEDIAAEAFKALPDDFKTLCDGVVIHCEDFPSEEVTEEMDCETPFDLLGLFQGIGMTDGPATAETGQMPNTIFLYRRPILDFWAEHGETLPAIITNVLVHEIGHHFGLTDEDMEEIEAGDDEFIEDDED